MACVQHVTQKKKRKLEHEGYFYVKNKEIANGFVSYECVKRRKGECKARIRVKDDEVFKGNHEHTHAPEPGSSDAVKALNSIRERAETTQETPQQIIADLLANMDDVSSQQLPPPRTIKRNIRRARKRVNQPHPLPTSVEDIEVPDDLKRLESGELFLIYDSGKEDNERFFIFGTESSLDVLANSAHVFMDGTFKIVPELFFQLYSIHAMTPNGVFPCAYALLPNKIRRTYQRLFEKMKELRPNMQPHPL